MRVGQWNDHLLLVSLQKFPHSAWLTTSTRQIGCLFSGREHQKGVRFGWKVEELAKRTSKQEKSVVFYFDQVILRLPHEGQSFEFSQVVSLVCLNLSGVESRMMRPLSEEVVVNQLFSPLNNALHHIQSQHSQTVKNVYAFVQQNRLHLSFCAFTIFNDWAKFVNLGKARLSRDDCPNRALNWSHFVLEVFDFFGQDWTVLLRGEAVNAVEENCSMVVGDQKRFPRL